MNTGKTIKRGTATPVKEPVPERKVIAEPVKEPEKIAA